MSSDLQLSWNLQIFKSQTFVALFSLCHLPNDSSKIFSVDIHMYYRQTILNILFCVVLKGHTSKLQTHFLKIKSTTNRVICFSHPPSDPCPTNLTFTQMKNHESSSKEDIRLNLEKHDHVIPPSWSSSHSWDILGQKQSLWLVFRLYFTNTP